MSHLRKVTIDPKGHHLHDRVATIIDFGNGKLTVGGPYTCFTCGEYVTLDLGMAAVAAHPCSFPEGITTVVTINVPSGKIVVTDSLYPQYEVDEASFASYNSSRGQAQVVEAMAAIGCGYGPVGNSCPTLYKTGDDTYVIANPAYDDFMDDLPTPENWHVITHITTDLWAYSIADYDDWIARGGDPSTLYNDAIIDVKPGVYQFTHHTGEKGFNRDGEGTVIFADIQRLDAA